MFGGISSGNKKYIAETQVDDDIDTTRTYMLILDSKYNSFKLKVNVYTKLQQTTVNNHSQMLLSKPEPLANTLMDMGHNWTMMILEEEGRKKRRRYQDTQGFIAFRRRWSKSSPASSFPLVSHALIRFLSSLCCVFIFFKSSSGSDAVDICGYSSVAAHRNCSFLWGSRKACACASLTFPLSLFTRMLCALGFRSLIFNRRWPSHPLNKRYAVLKVDGSSTSLVSVNLDALSNLPPDCSLQPNHIVCRVLSLKRSLSDTHVPPVLVHRCLVASYPYVSTNDPSSADKAFPTVDVLTCDKTIPLSSSIKHYNSSSAQSGSALWYPSNVSLRSGWSMADVSPSSFTAWAMPMENIQDVSPSFNPAFVGKSSSISSSSFYEERRLPLYLLSVKGAKVSVSSPSSLFSLNTILLSCVAVSTGPEDANENTSGFLVGWSSTSQSKVTNSQLADFVVQAPLTHSSSTSNPLSSSYEYLSASDV
ncbi:LOW QUALITY PROTEIN: hypothetical protein HID58_040688 [Brassica napus]|uniref:Uncharacterized protein n=1 Tax=Brassica napus TaxID=3708 RepID=A0ABQ8B8R8_BRANA|nr:LOW QUALITY PROTEIN: hypothetical protein HID58_040688 [Brassica napus]